jgi:hypothetical protein
MRIGREAGAAKKKRTECEAHRPRGTAATHSKKKNGVSLCLAKEGGEKHWEVVVVGVGGVDFMKAAAAASFSHSHYPGKCV